MNRLRMPCLIALALAPALLAGCASTDMQAPRAAPYVEEGERDPSAWARFDARDDGASVPVAAPAPRPAEARAGATSPTGTATAPVDGSEAPSSGAAAGGAPSSPEGRPCALARVEGAWCIDPSAADLEALGPSRVPASALGPFLPISREVRAGQGGRASVRDLRAAAGRLGAGLLLVARFSGDGERRVLTATLVETATGRVLGVWGPDLPALSLAAASLGRGGR